MFHLQKNHKNFQSHLALKAGNKKGCTRQPYVVAQGVNPI